MRVAVVGVGAIGGAVSWFLARAGHAVGVVDVRRDHLAAIERDGLVAEPSGEPVRLDTSPRGPHDLLLVATKSYSTEVAARASAGLTGDATLVATIQNGIGNDRVLAGVFGAHRVLAGATTIDAERAGPGRVRIGAATLAGRSSTVLGPPRDRPELLPRMHRLCAELTAAGLPAAAVDDADVAVWRKLALAGSMGPLAAVLGTTVEQTLACAPAVLVRLLEEIVAVARAEGVGLDAERTRDEALAVFASIGPHRPSMAVDVAEGRRTEIDAMCVEVARRAREHGLDAPANELLGALVRARHP